MLLSLSRDTCSFLRSRVRWGGKKSLSHGYFMPGNQPTCSTNQCSSICCWFDSGQTVLHWGGNVLSLSVTWIRHAWGASVVSSGGAGERQLIHLTHPTGTMNYWILLFNNLVVIVPEDQEQDRKQCTKKRISFYKLMNWSPESCHITTAEISTVKWQGNLNQLETKKNTRRMRQKRVGVCLKKETVTHIWCITCAGHFCSSQGQALDRQGKKLASKAHGSSWDTLTWGCGACSWDMQIGVFCAIINGRHFYKLTYGC